MEVARIAIIGSAEVLVRPSFKGLGASARQAGLSAGSAAGASLTSRMGGALASWGKKIAKAGAITVGAAVGAGIIGGVRSALSQQASTLVLTGLYDNAELAAKTMKSLNAVVKDSPLAGSAFRKGAESLAYAGVEGESAVKVLENVGKTIVGAGGTAEQMDQFTNGLLNGVNRGKFSLNELNQISKAGVPIFSALAEEMGVSMEEVTAMASAGEIGLDDMMSVLENADTDAFQKSLQAGEAASQSFGNTAKKVWNTVTETLGERLQPVLEWVTVHFRDLAEKVGPALEKWFDSATKKIKEFVKQWQDGEGPVGKLRTGFELVGSALKTAFGYVTGTVIPALSGMVRWMKENQAWLLPIAAGIGAIVVAWQAYQVTMGIVRGVTVAYTAVQAALNAVMALNPIGLVVLALVGLVAAFVTAYKKSETFRKIVDAAWNGIKVAAQSVWKFLKNYVFGPIISYYKMLWKVAVKAKDLIVAAWDSVKKGLGAGWNWIKTNVFDKFRAGIGAVKTTVQTQVDRIKSIWNGIKTAFKAPWDWVKKNVFDKFKSGLNTLKDNVSNISNSIGKAWRKIANKFRTPINWVLDKVWNGGIAKAFNNASKALGLKTKISDEARIPAFAKGGLARKGWALVGEEGPELVNFSNPGRVYTSEQTSEALNHGQDVASGALADVPAMGGWWDKVKSAAGSVKDGVVNAATGAVNWARGGLADAAAYLLKPIRTLVGKTVSKWGTIGSFAGDAGLSAVDSVIDWVRGNDDKTDFSADGPAPKIGGKGWRRPSNGPITSEYGMRKNPVSGIYRLHAGIDVAGGGATYAARAGKVSTVGYDSGAGNYINLSHGGGMFTRYLHNPSRGAIAVSPGQSVKAGQRVGRQGATGNVTGTHLHFELHKGGMGKTVNPRQLGVFDKGGLLPPGGLAYHSSRMSKPDVVLTSQQWADIHRNASNGGTGGAGGPQYIAQISTQTADGPEQIADAVLYGMRRLNRGGIHARN